MVGQPSVIVGEYKLKNTLTAGAAAEDCPIGIAIEVASSIGVVDKWITLEHLIR